MLLQLSIRNFALIENLNIEFSKGLNIMTGETGAGKSIIIDSVNFVLGERSSKDVISTGYEKTEVSAVFDWIDSPEFKDEMQYYGIGTDDVLILSREMNIQGRSICRVNGKLVTTSILKSIGNYLIDIHGQHEHQSLLDERRHIGILDLFGGNELINIKDKVREAYEEIKAIKSKLKNIVGDDYDRESKLGFLNYQIQEIDNAKLKPGEEEDLIKQKTILNNSEKLYSVLSSCYSLLYESSENISPVYDSLGRVLTQLKSICGIDDRINAVANSLENAYFTVEGAVEDIREYKEKIDFNPELINEVESRLDMINRLKMKYGKDTGEILKYRDKIYKEAEDIKNSDEIIDKLKKQIDQKSALLYDLSQKLSNLRKSIAKKLEKNIMDELKFLRMDKTKFEVYFDVLKKNGQVDFSENGIDIVYFLISANPGEPLKPLSKIASGGESSRIMLAIKTVMADADKIPCLIFDEIDTGISGKAAQAVAEKLGQISKSHQVICVTHLPQIASMADTHFYISKNVNEGKTRTKVEKLERSGQIKEIARMFGGAKITELTLRNAEEMLTMANELKTKKAV